MEICSEQSLTIFVSLKVYFLRVKHSPPVDLKMFPPSLNVMMQLKFTKVVLVPNRDKTVEPINQSTLRDMSNLPCSVIYISAVRSKHFFLKYGFNCHLNHYTQLCKGHACVCGLHTSIHLIIIYFILWPINSLIDKWGHFKWISSWQWWHIA